MYRLLFDRTLACDSKDDKVRLLATVKLLEVCERREQIERDQATVSAERAQVVADLSALYRKALEQPIVEAVVDTGESCESPTNPPEE